MSSYANASQSILNHSRRGFSLVELLVALAVIGVATSVFISLFNSSVNLAKSSANRRIAARLAEDQLTQVVQHPELFRWQIAVPGADETFPIKLAEDDPPAGNPFASPTALPLEPGAYKREQERYPDFRWTATGELRHAASHYVVTLVVHWEESGRDQKLALTTTAPRGPVDAARHARPAEAAQPAAKAAPAPEAVEGEGAEAIAEDAA